ncbi:MAG: DUF3626 domain-containing protein, partial [Planctomycetota bacterium]
MTLNFHPDGLGFGVNVLQRLVDEDYHSQFRTETSNGSLSAYPGGERWEWESRMFGGAYDNAPAFDRPKYGALNDQNNPYGASPRFGSCHLRLRPSVLQRCTFCYPDSYLEPQHFGIANRMNLLNRLDQDRTKAKMDPLDLYVEAHVHGPLRMANDVEAIVLDPSFRGTEIASVASK